MIQGVSVISSGVETSLSDGVVAFLRDHEGTGMQPRHDITQRGPMEHGESYLDYRLDPRDIDLLLMLTGSVSERATKRRTLMGLFHPDYASTLRFLADNGTRDIDVQFKGDGTVPTNERQPALEIVRLKFIARKPFYDPSGVTVPFAQISGGGAFLVPTAVPTTFGGSSLNQTQVIDTTGDPTFWRAEPIITITGPITDPIITNQLTGDKLDFTGTTLAGGTTYTIDTRYNKKTVVDQLGANQISKLAAGSSIASFDLRRGANSILVVGTGTTAATLIVFSYNGQHVAI